MPGTASARGRLHSLLLFAWLGLPPEGGAASPPDSIKDLLAQASSWVVAIDVERDGDLPGPAQARRRVPQQTRAYYQRPAGAASGLLLDAEGHVVTSLYNVAGSVKSMRVTLPEGTSHPARLVAQSGYDDLALLRIERQAGDPPIEFRQPLWAEATSLRPGMFAFALGRSPDPTRLTATRGIVSALGRNGGRALQTDAELNYGNVGGPLVDLEGRVIAITCFVGHTQPQWGLNSGVGFGTTASTLLEVLPRLKAGQNVEGPQVPFLGVRSDRTPADAGGARIQGVESGSAAAVAGMLAGDIVLEFNGTSLQNFEQLRRLIFSSKVGETVKLKVRRGEEVLLLEATLGRMVRP